MMTLVKRARMFERIVVGQDDKGALGEKRRDTHP